MYVELCTTQEEECPAFSFFPIGDSLLTRHKGNYATLKKMPNPTPTYNITNILCNLQAIRLHRFFSFDVISHPIGLKLITPCSEKIHEVGIYPSHLTSSTCHPCTAARIRTSPAPQLQVCNNLDPFQPASLKDAFLSHCYLPPSVSVPLKEPDGSPNQRPLPDRGMCMPCYILVGTSILLWYRIQAPRA